MFTEECINTFLENQEQLFPQAVAESYEAAEAFLEDCMAQVVDSIEEVREYLEESGADVEGMSDEELEDAATDEVENVQMDKFKNDNSLSEDEQKKAFKQHLKDIEKQKKAKEKQAASAAKVFCFDTLHDIERFAETLNLDKNIPSKLYKDVSNGKYYLFVKKGKLKFGDYTRVCHKLTEYAKLCSQQAYIEQYCKEHFECLISKNALKVLKEY